MKVEIETRQQGTRRHRLPKYRLSRLTKGEEATTGRGKTRCRSLSRSCHPLLAKLYLETRLLRLLKKAAQLAQRELLSRESVDSRGATHWYTL